MILEISRKHFDGEALDFDGTLATSRPLHDKARLIAFDQVASELADDRYIQIPPEIQAEAHHHGMTPQEIIGWVMTHPDVGLAKTKDDPEVINVVEHKKAAYNELVRTLGPEAVPGSVEFIRKSMVRFSGKVAIATTAHRDAEVRPYLRRYKLGTYFPDKRIIAAEDVTRPKPHPEVYEKAVKSLEIKNPRRCLALEDMPGGIEAARAAGLTVAAIATTKTVEELEALTGDQEPHIIIPSFEVVTFS